MALTIAEATAEPHSFHPHALGAGKRGRLTWGEAHETPRDSSAIPPRGGQKDAAPTSSMDSRPSSLRGVGDSQRGAPRICLLRSLGQSHQNLLPAKAKGSVLIYTHLLPGAANLIRFYKNVLDGSSWMRTAVVVVTCRGFAVVLGKLEQMTSSYFNACRLKASSSEWKKTIMRQIHLWGEKKATFRICLFAFSCNTWLTRSGIKEEIVTKRLFGIGWRRLMTYWWLWSKRQTSTLSSVL